MRQISTRTKQALSKESDAKHTVAAAHSERSKRGVAREVRRETKTIARAAAAATA